MRSPHKTLRRTLVCTLLAALTALPLTGCYSSWPLVRGTGLTDLNNVHTRGALVAAGKWALQRYKPATPVAFNLPADLRRSAMIEVVERIGGGSQVLTPETAASSTIYHLARITIRNDKAELDVIIPTGPGTYEMTQLRLVGRFESWRVDVAREWEFLVRPIPELAYLPETEYPAESQDAEGTIKPWQENLRGTDRPVTEPGQTEPAQPD